MGNYPEGDTYEATKAPSDIPFPDMDPGAPDDRGFGAPSGAFATGLATVEADGSVTTRGKAAPFGHGNEGAVDGGTP